MDEFEDRNRRFISEMSHDPLLRSVTQEWFVRASRYEYSYHFKWLGRPIIQFPQDIVAMQEIVWEVRPDLVIETGVAHGGSLVFYASLLELIGGGGTVVGIDVDIRIPNRREIERHPMARRIALIDGSSTDPAVIEKVRTIAEGRRALVALDSSHTHAHVLRELELYSPLVRRGSYIVVFDTVVEEMPDDLFQGRPWRKGNSPRTAVEAFLRATDRFVPDEEIERKLLITVSRGGYLKCVKD